MKKMYNAKQNHLYLFMLFISILSSICVHAQDKFTWTGATNTDWATAGNWTKTGSNGTDTYPGQTRTVDSVLISNGGSPVLANTLTIGQITIGNSSGPTSGSTLTINNTFTLTVTFVGTTAGSAAVRLVGGNIVNNGTLTINNTSSTANGVHGILCTTPTIAPSSATTYSYSGTGSLNITTSLSSAGSAVLFNGTNANSTYKISFPSATALTLASNAVALTVNASTTSPVIISGTGFTLGSISTGVRAAILTQAGNGSNVTIDNGTTLSLYSLTGGTARAVTLNFAAGSAVFTNNGTINVNGPITGVFILTNSNTTGTNALSFNNNGTIYANVTVSGTFAGVINLVAAAQAYGTNTNTIANSGTMTLINNSTVANTGYAIYTGNGTASSGSISTTINNTGSLELNGYITSTGGVAGRLTINNNNNGTFTLNPANSGACLDRAIFNNNSGGILDCKTSSISSGSGYTVTLNTGSTFKTANTSGTTSLSGSGAVQNTGVNYVFYASATSATTGTNLPSSLASLTISNSTGATTLNTASVGITGALAVTTGTLTLGSTTTLTLGNAASATISPNAKLFIQSGSTLNLADRPVTVQPNAAIILGGTVNNASNVTLQQTITAQRAYRIFANPFTTNQTDLSNTGLKATTSTLNDVKTWNNTTNAWVSGGSSYSSLTIPANTAYACFVRGASTDNVTGSTYTTGPSAFTYNVTGTINTSNYTVPTASNSSNFTIVGNPFPAPVNDSALTGAPNLPYYAYQASLNSTSARTKSGGWVAVLSSGSTSTIPVLGAIALQTTGNYSVRISGINTTSPSAVSLFGAQNPLQYVALEVEQNGVFQDKMYVRLDANATVNSLDRTDLAKFYNDNGAYVYAISPDNNKLAVDARNVLTAVPLGFIATTGNYNFKLVDNSLPKGASVVLKDNYLHTETVLNIGDSYAFVVNADAASKGEQRFELNFAVKKSATTVDNIASGFGVNVLGNVINNRLVVVNINGAANNAAVLKVVNMSGKQLMTANLVNGLQYVDLGTSSEEGMLLLQVTDSKGNSVVKKIMKL